MTTTQTDSMGNLDKSYEEIRQSQFSLVSLAESVPEARVTFRPVTTVKFRCVETELTLVRNDREIQVFECFFPEGDTKYMCGICTGHGRDVKTHYAPGHNRELLPDLIRKYTEPKPEPFSEQEINRLKYLISDISSILAKHGANLEAVTGGLRLRTGEPGHGTVAFNLVDKEAE